MVLIRNNDEVYYGDKKLTIVKQASKGEGKEVVKIEGLESSNGQKWVSLSKLKQGENEIECNGREVTTTKKYELTQEEQAEIDQLEARIKEIKENAMKRYVPPINYKKPIKINELTTEQKIEYMNYLETVLTKLKAN